jgi:ketosteroid isomerase-like protein
VRWSAALLIAIAASGSPLAAQSDAADLRAEVRAAETAFAATLAARDLAGFAGFVSEEAVFVGRSAYRGRAAVVEAWRSYFETPDAPFSWAPETVEVLDSGELAMTSGPVYDPAGARIGTFHSTWRRAADGRWRVIFDQGCP